MTLLYPCGVDIHGVQPFGAAEKPVVVSDSYLLQADFQLEVRATFETIARVELIYCIGPCSLESVLIGPILVELPKANCRRWARINRIVESNCTVVCLIKCLPAYFMLTDSYVDLREPPKS